MIKRYAILEGCLFLTFVVVQTASAAVWSEIGDAPASIPGQATVGTGQLTAINGDISRLGDADLYAIWISDPAAFSATVVSGPDYPNPGLDTLLWLFRSDGTGVYANDDKGASSNFIGGYDFTSQLSAGNPNGPTTPGVYYLAISSYRYAPFDANGDEIFGNTNTDTGGGQGPTSALPLAYWYATGTDVVDPSDPTEIRYEEGPYEIDLTGVEPLAVPEPSSSIELTVIGAICAGSMILAKRRGFRQLP